MPTWLIKLAIALVFGPPMLLGIGALVFGDLIIRRMDQREEHEKSS